MPTVDNLDIEISASVSKANASLDLLVKRLGKVSASLSGVNTRGIATMASGVNKLANAMNNFSNNTNTAVFTRLTRNLNSLGNIDQNAIANASKSLGKIAGAMKVFNNINVSDNARQLGDLARGISQLGYKSSTQAIQNIPQLATAMRNLMQTLSTAPRVSQNLIDMTNALGRLARTGASSGRAATSLGKSLGFFSKSTVGARRSSLSLASAIGKLYATYWLLFRAFGKIGQTIDIASGLQEVQNVVDVTFRNFKQKVEDLAKVSIADFGMSELTAKQIAGRFQAMGTAMGIAQGKMSDMSIELTKLSADMASFYNVAQEDVARSLQSVFTGEAEPLRKYGVDLTQATLKTFALSQGLNSNVEAMTQAEKTMLRYQYVMHATGAAQGDFARTSNNWANQIRILKGNFQELAGIIGTSFINALKPLVQALNSAMRAIINFAKVVSNSLGKIFGWQYEETGGGVTADMESASDYADDLASGTGKAADNAKKLKQQLQGIDELNVLTTPSDTGGSGGSGGGAGGGATDSGNTGGWTKTDGLLKDYESQLDTLYKLGEHIGNTLTNAMKKIDWDSIYEGARNFGSGLASFLNGLISPELFGEVGKTIASSLNTALYSLNSFGKTFDWKDFGNSIASGINNFFSTFDFANLADTINEWVDGVKTTLTTAIEEIEWKDVIKGAFDFVGGLELDTMMIAIGAVAWKYKGKEVALSALGTLLSTEIATGIGSITIPLGATIGLSITTAIVGFKIGNELYDHVPAVQEASDALAELLVGTFDGEFSLNDYIQGGIEMSIDLGVKLLNLLLPDGSEIDANTISEDWLPKYLASYLFGDETEKRNATDYFVNIGIKVAETAETFYTNHIKPLIDGIKGKAIELGINVKGKALEIITKVKNKWNKLKKAVKKKLKPKISLSDSISSKLYKIQKLWNYFKNNLKLKLSATFNDNFTGAIKRAWNKIATSINGFLDKIPVVGGKIPDLPTFAGYANGGFPEDGWFRASRGEIMGRFDNGQSVVANNMQITQGISDAVYRGNQALLSVMQQELMETRQQNEYLQQLLQKETGISYKEVGKASQKFAREYSNRTGKPAYI